MSAVVYLREKWHSVFCMPGFLVGSTSFNWTPSVLNVTAHFTFMTVITALFVSTTNMADKNTQGNEETLSICIRVLLLTESFFVQVSEGPSHDPLMTSVVEDKLCLMFNLSPAFRFGLICSPHMKRFVDQMLLYFWSFCSTFLIKLLNELMLNVTLYPPPPTPPPTRPTSVSSWGWRTTWGSCTLSLW